VPEVTRYWIRNTRTGQVLGSVWASEDDEAIGKAMVKFGIHAYQQDGFTLQVGGANAQDLSGASAGDDARRASHERHHAARKSRAGGKGRQAVRGEQ
jgi:hypothetical protein